MAKPSRKLSTAEAKAEFITLIGKGFTVEEAASRVGRSRRSAYEYWRRTDEKFAADVDRVRAVLRRGGAAAVAGDDGDVREPVPDFPEFCERFLGQRLFGHQLQWFDLLEGREPRDLHPSMTFEAAAPTRSGVTGTRLVVNTPPNHAKSTTITVNYVVWRIVKDPNVKVVIVSKKQDLAKQFLLQIKERLTSPQYDDLQRAFAPPGGWKEGSASWKADQFYVGGRDAEAKDPTVQAIGIRGTLYGSRSDLIIVDDPIDFTNVGEAEKQVEWIQSIVNSRLTPRTGRTFIVGTRMASKDLYSVLLDPSRYAGGKQPWAYLRQPAVLQYADDPADWVTLWPWSNMGGPEDEPNSDGLFPRWDGDTLADVRDGMTPALWARVYQQEQLADDAVFDAEMVQASIQGRPMGLIPDSKSLGREGGMLGLKLIAGIDPAAAGFTAFTLLGLDPKTGHRWVVDLHNEAGMSPDKLRGLIKAWTEKYGVHEWRVEANAFQSYLARDPELAAWLATRGSVLTAHHTGQNKHDPDFGVMAMSALFEHGLIHLPNLQSQAAATLVEQLMTWQPKPPKSLKTDMVMSLWFAELRCQELARATHRKNTFQSGMFTTRGDKESRRLVGRDEANAASTAGWWGR